MATNGNDDLLNKPIGQFTLEELRRAGILDYDNFKVPDNVPGVDQYAVRLAKSDLLLLAQLLVQEADAAARRKAAAAKKAKPAAKKAPAKASSAKTAASKAAPTKKPRR